jgi:hypothetical protein
MAESDSFLKSDVFERERLDAPEVSDATYNMVIGLVLCWGFLANWLIVRYVDTASLASIHPLIFLALYFG